jgi:hypothetical protein
MLSSHWLYTEPKMAEKRVKTAQVNLRLEPALKAAAERAAAADMRSLTSYIEKLIVEDLKTQKVAPAPSPRKR